MNPHRSDSSPAPTFRPARSRLIPRWCGFWCSAPMLVVSVLMEGAYSLFAALLFLLTRRRQREKFTRALLGHSRSAGVLLVVVAVLFVASGCTTMPAASFGAQVDHLAWTFSALGSDLGSPSEAGRDFYFMSIGDMSLEPLAETFEMLGW